MFEFQNVMSPSTELLASFRNLRRLSISIQTAHGKALSEQGFHANLKDSLRLHKSGVSFSSIDIRVYPEYPRQISQERTFSGHSSYSYDEDGTETVRGHTWPTT
jgi:hypothetical protein